MHDLGRLVLLQVQVDPLKPGPRGARRYDPSRILAVDALTITPEGVLGHLDDRAEPIVDVHHRDHPASRFRGTNPISLGTLGHYASLRQGFGDHVHDGIGGENLVVDRPGRLDLADLADGVLVETDDPDHPLELGVVEAAEPCVEFARLVVADPEAAIAPVLQRLRGGARGYYLQPRSPRPVRIRRGAVLRARPAT